MNDSMHVHHGHHDMDNISIEHIGHMAPEHEHPPGHMDHSSHMDHMDMMKMYFHFGYKETILFSFWQISSPGGLIGSFIGIYILGVVYEGLKYFREYLFWKHYSSLQYRTVQGQSHVKTNNEENSSRVVNLVPDIGHRWIPSMCSKHHFFQSCLHIIQVFISYLLMLIFMTFNVWLCIAIILGSATGYVLFGWKKALFVDITEHCH